MPTPNLRLPTLAQGQAQKEIAHNHALLRLNALVQTSVKSRALATPRASPANGDRWIVPSGATGVWAGQTDKIAFWREGAWAYLSLVVGWRVHVEDERLTVVWTDGAWRDRIVGTANGGAIRLVALEQELTLTGAFVDATPEALTLTWVVVERVDVGVYRHDAIPWCGLLLGVVVHRANTERRPERNLPCFNLSALEWAAFGTSVLKGAAVLGDALADRLRDGTFYTRCRLPAGRGIRPCVPSPACRRNPAPATRRGARMGDAGLRPPARSGAGLQIARTGAPLPIVSNV